MSNAPSFLAWVPAVAAGQTAAVANYAFANNGGPGDTISDTLGTAAALTALNAAFDTHVVAVGDRLLVNDQTPSWQNGVYVASSVATVFGQAATLTMTAGGTGYTNGQYYNLATTTNGSGTGALVDVTVVGGVVTAISIAQQYVDAPGETPTGEIGSGSPAGGSGYAVGDTVVPVGIGSGTGLSVTVATLQSAFVLTRAPDANTADQFPGMAVFISGGATLAGRAYVQTNGSLTLDVVSQISGTSTITQPTATMYSPIVDGTYTNVPLAGGHGSLAAATVVVSGSGTPGGIATTSGLVGGTGYDAGGSSTYTAVPLTGGAGSGAQATIVVASGVVTTVTITAAGSGYAVGNTLSASNANLGGSGSGFSVNVATVTGAQVSSVTITSVGSGYANDDVLTFAGMSGSGVSTSVNTYGIGTGGTVEVTTSTPASSAVTFVELVS